MEIYQLVLPKAGEAPEDCEDRLAIASDVGSRALRAAVADGATSTAFSGRWAELLVGAYCERAFASWDDLLERSKAASERWVSDVHGEYRPWHARMRAESGAAAAIAAIELGGGGTTWMACALGDSCVFHVRANQIIDVLPAQVAEGFDDHPRLIATDMSKNVGLRRDYATTSGTCAPGDLFVLATDAAAEALLRANRRTGGIGVWLGALRSGEVSASRRIQALRRLNCMQDDDVAVVVIGV